MCDILQSIKHELSNIENDCFDENKENLECYEVAEPHLLSLPVEIILKICSFLDPHFLKHTLRKVCSRLENILADDHLWKYWIHSKITGCFPVLPQLKIWEEVDVNWEDVCVEMDVEKKKWCNVKETMNHIVTKDVHFASVDTVLLVNNGEMCVSGSRDRSMILWKVKQDVDHETSSVETTNANVQPSQIRPDAHSGWVWDLAYDNADSTSTVYSASWDNTVKAWDLTDFQCVQTFQCGMAALSLITNNNLVMAGLCSKKVLSFDLRAGPNHIRSYNAHKGPVLKLATHNNLIASVCEDKTLAVFDTVANKLLVHDVKMPSDKAFPVCISWNPSALYIGDSKGTLHLVHPTEFAYLKCHEIWPEPPMTQPSHKITSCFQTEGNLILCSDQGEIKFMYNCYPPQEYGNLKTSTYNVTQLKYQNGVLVIGTCDSALEFWIPNENYPNL